MPFPKDLHQNGNAGNENDKGGHRHENCRADRQLYFPVVRVRIGCYRIFHGRKSSICRCAGSAKGHRNRIVDQGNCGCSQRWKAQADEQRGGQCGRHPKTGGAFQKCAEQESDDDGLKPGIGCDIAEDPFDGGHRAGPGQGIHQQNRPENDHKDLK